MVYGEEKIRNAMIEQPELMRGIIAMDEDKPRKRNKPRPKGETQAM